MKTQVAQFWYGLAAPFYDWLRDLAYPKAKQLTFELIYHLPETSNVLVIGGGTGEWLPHLTSAQPEMKIHFVELSKQMLSAAKKRVDSPNIEWIHQDAKTFSPDDQIELIILPFFLDHFTSDEITKWIKKFESYTKHNYTVAIVDFKQNEKQSLITRLFVALAGFMLGLNQRSLPDILAPFQENGYATIWKTESDFFIAATLQKQ